MLASILCGICPPVPITVVRTYSLPLSRVGKTAPASQPVGHEKTGPRSERGPAIQHNLRFRQNVLKRPLRASSLVLVLALGKLFDDLGAERLEVTGVAAGDEALVGHNLLVYPIATGITYVGLEARVGRQRSTVHDVGLHEGPGAVADDPYGLGLLEEGVDEVHGVFVGAQRVSSHGAARYDQAVVFVR